jgi:hypothetical protein
MKESSGQTSQLLQSTLLSCQKATSALSLHVTYWRHRQGKGNPPEAEGSIPIDRWTACSTSVRPGNYVSRHTAHS